MARPRRQSDLKLSGGDIGTRFATAMSLSLAVVMLVVGFFLHKRVVVEAERIQEKAFVEAVLLQGPRQKIVMEALRRDLLGLKSASDVPPEAAMPLKDRVPVQFENGLVRRLEVMYGSGGKYDQPGFVYQYMDPGTPPRPVDPPLIVSSRTRERAGEGLFALILGVTAAVILAGAIVALLVGKSVSQPLQLIVEDIGQIARGNLRHRTRVRAGGEIMVLARSIDRMAANLEEAQQAQLELSVREREIALASDVREALLPEDLPVVPGYQLSSLHVECPSPGGDFHDFVQLEGGRIGLLVCEASGRGIPGAMIGAIARSYLRVELQRAGEDVAAAFSRANRELARDVRRGMYVTALYALLDPGEGIVTVACAGHKLPLVRFDAAEGKLRVLHPEGIALGFDRGPVFDRTLQVQKVPVDPGDRIVLATTGGVQVREVTGQELGEKEFYRLILQHARRPTGELLEGVRTGLVGYAGEAPFPNDISMIAVAREG